MGGTRATATMLALALALAWGTGLARADEPACLADALPRLEPSLQTPPACHREGTSCEVACRDGDADACLMHAYALQREPDKAAEARPFYRQACLAGSANGCTNHAAGIWASDHSDEELVCAGRLFDAACAVGDHFACGMAPRVALARADSEEARARARSDLRAHCDRVGGFPCRVLARELESKPAGSHDRASIVRLLERACRGGDPDACGSPKTAAETFD